MVAAFCWGGGLAISAIGVSLHQLWIMWPGSGVIGGVGLGLGYISPVSTLIKWFPDRRGMATGMAIMGFGGGAMIGSPLAVILMRNFQTPTDVGVWQTFLILGAIYFVFMIGGAFAYRVPPDGWKPDGWTAAANKKSLITTRHVHVRDPTNNLVLAHLACPYAECLRRHRRYRHRLADASGNLWGVAYRQNRLVFRAGPG